MLILRPGDTFSMAITAGSDFGTPVADRSVLVRNGTVDAGTLGSFTLAGSYSTGAEFIHTVQVVIPGGYAPGDVVQVYVSMDGDAPLTIAGKSEPFTVSGFSAAAGEEGGLLKLGTNNAGITLAPGSGPAINLTPASGAGLAITPPSGAPGITVTTTNANAAVFQANTAGAGLVVTGASGGMAVTGTGTGTYGLRLQGNAPNSFGLIATGSLAGVQAQGAVNGAGLVAIGAGTGHGAVFTHGGASADDVFLTNSDAPTFQAAVLVDPGESAGLPVGLAAMIRRIWESSSWGNKRARDRGTGTAALRNKGDTANLMTVNQSTAGAVDTQTAGA